MTFSEVSQVSILGFQSRIQKAMSGVHGCLLEVTVVECKGNFYLQEDPYVCLEYGSNRYHTRTCKDGGDQGLVFQEKLVFTLFEGSREITISVYSNNSFRRDDFIGSGRVQLQRVISQGYDDTAWPIFGESGMTTGEVCLMLCCPTVYLPNPYYRPTSPNPSNFAPSHTLIDPQSLALNCPPRQGSNLMNMSRGLKRPFLYENYDTNEEELGRDPMRRKLTTEAEGGHLQPTELLDIAMDDLLDRTSPATLDEDTEMDYGSHLPSNPYPTIWDTICF